MKNCLHYVLLLSVLLSSSLLSSCGKTGPLYLPEPDSQQDSTAPAQQEK